MTRRSWKDSGNLLFGTTSTVFLVLLVLIVVSKGNVVGWIDSKITSEVPVGAPCSQPLYGDNETPTVAIVARAAQQVAPSASSESIMAAAEVGKAIFGATLGSTDYVQVCPSADDGNIATVNTINIGR